MTNPKLGTLAQEFECESDEFQSTL